MGGALSTVVAVKVSSRRHQKVKPSLKGRPRQQLPAAAAVLRLQRVWRGSRVRNRVWCVKCAIAANSAFDAASELLHFRKEFQAHLESVIDKSFNKYVGVNSAKGVCTIAGTVGFALTLIPPLMPAGMVTMTAAAGAGLVTAVGELTDGYITSSAFQKRIDEFAMADRQNLEKLMRELLRLGVILDKKPDFSICSVDSTYCPEAAFEVASVSEMLSQIDRMVEELSVATTNDTTVGINAVCVSACLESASANWGTTLARGSMVASHVLGAVGLAITVAELAHSLHKNDPTEDQAKEILQCIDLSMEHMSKAIGRILEWLIPLGAQPMHIAASSERWGDRPGMAQGLLPSSARTCCVSL